MRTKCLIIILFYILSITDQGYSQKGFKYCQKNYIEDYDFRAQSGFAWLAPGDTAFIKVVLYSGMDYRIFVCGPSKLGEINFRIIEEIKERERKMKEISNKDTIWLYVTNVTEDVLFDSSSNNTGNEYWEATVNKTKRLVIEVSIQDTGREGDGVVDVLVGQKSKSQKRFNKAS